MSHFEKIALNRVKLDCCEQHEFETHGVEVQIGKRVKCKRCGGEMSLIQANEYVRGFAAGGGNPELVWEGWSIPGYEDETRCPCCLGNKKKDCSLCNGQTYISKSKAKAYLEGNFNADE